MSAAPPVPIMSGSSYSFFWPWIPPTLNLKPHIKTIWTVVLGALAMWTAYFYAANLHTVRVDLLWFSMESSVAWFGLSSAFSGFFFASLVFYARQSNLVSEIALLQKDKATRISDHTFLDGQYQKFKTVASQILVPFPLDQLVEKAELAPNQLGEIAYKPRQLLAGRHSSARDRDL